MTPILPIDASDPIGSLDVGCYEARFYLTQGTSDVYLGHVDIYERTKHKCRIAVASNPGHQATVADLEKRARRWIAARRRGEPAGSTSYDTLPASPASTAEGAQCLKPSTDARGTLAVGSSRSRTASSTTT